MLPEASTSSSDRWPGRDSRLRIFVDVASPACQAFAQFAETTNPYMPKVLCPTPLACTHCVLDPKLPRLNLPLRDHLERLDDKIQVVSLDWFRQCLLENRTIEEDLYRLGPTGSAGPGETGTGKGKEREVSRFISMDGGLSDHKRRRTSQSQSPVDRDSVMRSRPRLAESDARFSPDPVATGGASTSTVDPAAPSSSAPSFVLPSQSIYSEQEFEEWCNIKARFSHSSQSEQQSMFMKRYPARTAKSVGAWISSPAWKERIEARVSTLRAQPGAWSPAYPAPKSPAPATQTTTGRTNAWVRWSDQEDRDLAHCLATRGKDTIYQACARFVEEYSPSRSIPAAQTRYITEPHRPRFDAMIAEIQAEETAKREARDAKRPSTPLPVASPARIPAHLMSKTLDDLHTSLLRGSSQPRPEPRPVAVDAGLAMLHRPAQPTAPLAAPINPASASALSSTTISLGIASLFAPVASATHSSPQLVAPMMANVQQTSPTPVRSSCTKRSDSPAMRSSNPFARDTPSRPATPNQSPPSSSAPTLDELKKFRTVGGPPPACLLANPSNPFCFLCGVVGAPRYEFCSLHQRDGNWIGTMAARVCAGCSVYVMEQTESVGLELATEMAYRFGEAQRKAKVDEMI